MEDKGEEHQTVKREGGERSGSQRVKEKPWDLSEDQSTLTSLRMTVQALVPWALQLTPQWRTEPSAICLAGQRSIHAFNMMLRQPSTAQEEGNRYKTIVS